MNEPQDTTERWKAIPGYEGLYEVSSQGRVRSLPRYARVRGNGTRFVRARILRPNTSSRYQSVVLSRENHLKTRLIHALVLEAFVGPAPEGMQGCHWDRDKSNNVLSNLRWDTPKGNDSDKERHGTIMHGSRNGNSKLREEQIAEVEQLLYQGLSQWDIANKLGVHQGTISRIHLHKSWRRVLDRD